jgi:hypothetical protein
MHQIDEIAEIPIPTLDGLSNALEIVKVQYPGSVDGFNPMEMWDLSFARQALRRERAAK